MAHIYNCYMGHAVLALERGHTVTFRPNGKLKCHDNPNAAEEARKRHGHGGYSARIFMGLSVGTKETYTVANVVKAVIAIREGQGLSPNASILTQMGIYEDRKKRVIVENSVQIILIDLENQKRKAFEEQILTLAEALIDEFEQESVIVEIQKRGVVQDVIEVSSDGEPGDDEDEEEEENDDDE